MLRAVKRITLVILNEDMDDIFRIIKSLENLDSLIEGVSETVKHETKNQEGGCLGMLWTLGASILGNMLTGKEVLREGRGYNDVDLIDKNF